MQNPAAFRWMFAQLKQLQKLQHFAGSATAGGKPKLDFGYQLQEARRINTCKRQAQQNLIGCLCSGLRKKPAFLYYLYFFPQRKKHVFFLNKKNMFFSSNPTLPLLPPNVNYDSFRTSKLADNKVWNRVPWDLYRKK